MPVLNAIETRLVALESKEVSAHEIATKAVEAAFGPRVTPAPGASPSESSSNVVHGNSAAVKAAGEGNKEVAPIAGAPEHLQWYLQNGAGIFGNAFNLMGDDAAAAAVAAASVPAGV